MLFQLLYSNLTTDRRWFNWKFLIHFVFLLWQVQCRIIFASGQTETVTTTNPKRTPREMQLPGGLFNWIFFSFCLTTLYSIPTIMSNMTDFLICFFNICFRWRVAAILIFAAYYIRSNIVYYCIINHSSGSAILELHPVSALDFAIHSCAPPFFCDFGNLSPKQVKNRHAI